MTATPDGARRFGEHPRLAWSVLGVAFLSLISPALAVDDIYFFNYMNNVADPQAVFYHRHYVQLAPELVAYALRGLPLAAQAVLYRVPSLCLIWLLSREVYLLIRTGGHAGESVMLSTAVVLMLWWCAPLLFTSLTWTSVALLLLSLTHVARIGLEGRAYSTIALAGLVLTVSSIPLGLVVVAPLLLQAAHTRDVRMRRQTLLAVLVLTAVGVWLNAPTVTNVIPPLDPLGIIGELRTGFTNHGRIDNIVVTVSSAVLLLAGANSLFGRCVPSRAETLPLAFMGLACVLVVAASDRIPATGGGFGANHTLVPLLCALLVVSRAIVATTDRYRRALGIGVVVGVAGAATATILSTQLRGPLETALMKYRFLMVADEFRRDCRDGEAMVFEHDDTSPVVLCRPRQFAPGRYLQSHVPPSVGGASREASDEVPRILVFDPFRAARQTDWTK